LRSALLDPDSIDVRQSPDHDPRLLRCESVKRVLVFCGSSPGTRPEYVAAANELGRLLAERHLVLVYGAASVGVMGAIADATLAAGGKAIGVIPTRLVEAEIAHAGLTELHVTDTMHERKALMSELSDGVVVLPGGIGTLDEFFELFTWTQLGLSQLPLGILDVAGYWDPLLQLLEHMVNERFLRPEHLDTLIVSKEPGTLLDRLAEHKPRTLDKWLDRRSDQVVPNTRSPASPKPGRM
jgi:uncharacterized protein (TIGR00730 family)